MSISIKNIQVTIDGTQSNMFKIQLDGAKYRLDGFTLSQNLLQPNVLSFVMYKDPEEDVNEPQFGVCKAIIGKKISIYLQTDPMEQEIPSFSDEGKMADIEFEGYIFSASGSRDGSQYTISVEARSWDAFLIDSPHCESWENKTLNDIVDDTLAPYGGTDGCGMNIDARFQEAIEYTVQYNENDFQFLRRLALRYGEWFYFDGKQLVFGNMPEGESVTLSYPSKDIPSYSVRMEMKNVHFNHTVISYYSDGGANLGERVCVEQADREYNELNTAVFEASKYNYCRIPTRNLHSGGWIEEDSKVKRVDISSKTEARGIKASMLVYDGTTYCSKLKLGGKLVIKDNFISDKDSNNKSEVQQDEIIVIGLTHRFSVDERYSNTFRGIPAACDYPPYTGGETYPYAQPCRGWVNDNEDPQKLGRIRVQLEWAAGNNELITPWLRIAQPYAGSEKGVHILPEIGEEVMVDFEQGNAERPFVCGALFNKDSGVDEKWYPGDNEVKAIRTNNGHTIEIHDKKKGGFIKIYDNKKNNYVVTLSTDGDAKIKISSSKDIEINAKNDINIHADHDININADHDINVEAQRDIWMEAQEWIDHHAGLTFYVSADEAVELIGEKAVGIASNNKSISGKIPTQATEDSPSKMMTPGICLKCEGRIAEKSSMHSVAVDRQYNLGVGEIDSVLSNHNFHVDAAQTVEVKSGFTKIQSTGGVDIDAMVISLN